MKSNDDKHLLFIEPERGDLHEPVLDLITRGTVKVLSLAKPGQSYKGWHTCACGAHSGSTELWVEGPNGPVLTNSLAVHYVAFHRDEVPRSELKKMADILYFHCDDHRGELDRVQHMVPTAEQLARPNTAQSKFTKSADRVPPSKAQE